MDKLGSNTSLAVICLFCSAYLVAFQLINFKVNPKLSLRRIHKVQVGLISPRTVSKSGIYTVCTTVVKMQIFIFLSSMFELERLIYSKKFR